MPEQLAIIQRARVSDEDHAPHAVVFFETYIDEGRAATQIVSPTTPEFLSVWDVMRGNVENLNGRACWVEVDSPFIRFKRMAKI